MDIMNEIEPFQGFEGDYEKYDEYNEPLGYVQMLVIYSYYDGPLFTLCQNAKGDHYLCFNIQYDEKEGNVWAYFQATVDEITRYHNRELLLEDLFKASFDRNSGYLRNAYGRYAIKGDTNSEVVGDSKSWVTLWDDFNKRYLNYKEPELYYFDDGDIHAKATFDPDTLVITKPIYE